MALELDHLVINTKYALDEYETLFKDLGFTVTPKSHHSLGSVNQSIVFDGHYLELIGLGNGVRKDLLESNEGVDGLVFKLNQLPQTVAALNAASFEHTQPQDFFRPIDGKEENAWFTVIRLLPGQFREGRVYFCHHHTPYLIWDPAVTSHPNGVTAIKRLYISSRNPEQTLEQYGKLGTVGKGFDIRIDTEENFEDYFSLEEVGVDRFAAIAFKASNLDRLEAVISSRIPVYKRERNRLWFRAAWGTILEFES